MEEVRGARGKGGGGARGGWGEGQVVEKNVYKVQRPKHHGVLSNCKHLSIAGWRTRREEGHEAGESGSRILGRRVNVWN